MRCRAKCDASASEDRPKTLRMSPPGRREEEGGGKRREEEGGGREGEQPDVEGGGSGIEAEIGRDQARLHLLVQLLDVGARVQESTLHHHLDET